MFYDSHSKCSAELKSCGNFFNISGGHSTYGFVYLLTHKFCYTEVLNINYADLLFFIIHIINENHLLKLGFSIDWFKSDT